MIHAQQLPRMRAVRGAALVALGYKGERLGEARPLHPVANDRKPATGNLQSATAS